MANDRAAERDDMVTRLRKVEGQIRGLQRMIAEDADRVDVLTQISAVKSAIDKVALRLLGSHVRGHLSSSPAKGGGEARVDEVMRVIERFIAS